MLIRHPDSERGYDLYETPEVATLALLLAEPLPRTICEPAFCPGAIVRVLRDAGHRVIATDLIDCIVTSPRQGGTMSALQCRLMQKLVDHVDRVTQADRLFFERFPHPQHRVRLARAEVHQHELIDGKRPPIPPGYRLFAVVRNIAPGARMRLVLPAPEGRETDVCEATARAIFQAVSSPIEARLRKAAGARP